MKFKDMLSCAHQSFSFGINFVDLNWPMMCAPLIRWILNKNEITKLNSKDKFTSSNWQTGELITISTECFMTSQHCSAKHSISIVRAPIHSCFIYERQSQMHTIHTPALMGEQNEFPDMNYNPSFMQTSQETIILLKKVEFAENVLSFNQPDATATLYEFYLKNRLHTHSFIHSFIRYLSLFRTHLHARQALFYYYLYVMHLHIVHTVCMRWLHTSWYY